MLWTHNNQYKLDPFDIESELEASIKEVGDTLFGPNRIYLEVKRKIGAQGKTNNIPDGYLIDLTSPRRPVIYVVENELAKHDPLSHIAQQILNFSLSFVSTPKRVKEIVKNALYEDPVAKSKCENYAKVNGFENIDYLLEKMIYDAEFQALVIIDELHDELETVLFSRFKFGVEVIELSRFTNNIGEHVYQFEPFLAEVTAVEGTNSSNNNGKSPIDQEDIDTIVAPAMEDGFQETAIGENRWYQIRINNLMIPKIKYIAMYRSAPISAITHVAPVKSVEQWKNSNKYVVNFLEPLREISPVKLVSKGKVKAPQGIRYTSYNRLINAKTIDEAF
jgi:hypothetical protein